MSRLTRSLSLALLCSAAIAGCGSDGSDATAESKVKADQIVADAKAQAEQIKADAAAEADTAAQPDASEDVDVGAENDESSGGGLPNLVGKGLQYAQDASQAAGFYGLTSHDAAGRGRQQVLDRNWKVCTQSPKPGSTNKDATVDFGAVKTAEKCPKEDQGTKEVKAAGATMPSLAGKSASVAEDALPGASIEYEDGTGDGRTVIIASNWKVCSQKPSAGAAYSGVPVTLTVVKYGEGC